MEGGDFEGNRARAFYPAHGGRGVAHALLRYDGAGHHRLPRIMLASDERVATARLCRRCRTGEVVQRDIALKAAEVTLPALAQDGSIADRTPLVMPSPAVERLALPSRFLLKHKERAAVLDKLSSMRGAPTVQILLDAFVDDGGNFTALHPRSSSSQASQNRATTITARETTDHPSTQYAARSVSSRVHRTEGRLLWRLENTPSGKWFV